jgi:hypothetical protein
VSKLSFQLSLTKIGLNPLCLNPKCEPPAPTNVSTIVKSVLFFSEETQIWSFGYLQIEYKDPGVGLETRVYAGVWEDTCLLQDMSGEIIIEDQFADSYTVIGPISGTVTRTGEENVCIWSGTRLTLTNLDYQWKVNNNNKLGFQNTPVGSYAGGFTVS